MRTALLAAFCALCLAAVAGPDYLGVGNRVDPRVLGLPFSLVWNLIWVALSFGALGLYHLTGRDEA